MSLKITGYHSIEHYVENLDRLKQYYTDVLQFKEIGRSTSESEEQQGMRRVILCGGPTIHVVLSSPLTEWSVASQYLNQHPEGVGFLNFRTKNLDQCVDFLDARKATFLYETQKFSDDRGKYAQIAMATALDNVSVRIVDDSQFAGFGPGFEMSQEMGSYETPFKFECIDHVTSNVRTLQPLTSFFTGVMGFEDFWGIEFHTNDVNPDLPVGSGLKSAVVWHPDSGVKFANNEPAPPFFRNSQIDVFLRDQQGSGVQHIALRVPKIIPVMEELRQSGASFLDAPDMYYERVPERLKKAGFAGNIAEPMTDLAKNSILIDGNENGYLLQIFSHELGRQFKDPKGGPFFFEIIQREGDDGFGGGNFRALFETIEVDQIAMKKTQDTLPLELL